MIDKKRRSMFLGILSIPVMLSLPSFLYKIKITSNTIVNKGGWLLLDSDS
jgi:hypothetical protein